MEVVKLIIVWVSLGIIALALIWLIIRVIVEAKAMKSVIVDVSKKTEHLRKASEAIVKQQENLQATTADLIKDVQDKKSAIQYTQSQTKDLVRRIRTAQKHIVQAFKQQNTDKHEM